MKYLGLKNNLFHDYTIARVYNREQYLYIDNKIFVINRKNIESISSDGAKITYKQELFQNGKLVYTPYDRISDIPTYLIIDTILGEVKAYSNISDIPIGEQNILTKVR